MSTIIAEVAPNVVSDPNGETTYTENKQKSTVIVNDMSNSISSPNVQTVQAGDQEISSMVARSAPGSASIPDEQPLQSFNRFKDLPLELRLMIWSFAIPPDEPRIIPIEPYNIGRSLTRIWNSRSIFIESTEAWQAFLETPHIKALPEENKDGKLRSVIIRPNEQKLWNVHPTCATLQNLMDACDESRGVVSESSYVRTFGVFGDRPTILFVSPNDTFYISQDVLFDPPRRHSNGQYLSRSGGFYCESGWCWELNRVDKLAIGKSTFSFEFASYNDLRSDWIKEVVSWFRNVDRVTLVLEYDLVVDTDVSDFVFMDLPELEMAQERTTWSEEKPGYSTDTMAHSIELDGLKNELSRHGSFDTPPNLPTSLILDRKIMMTSKRKLELSNVDDWKRSKDLTKAFCLLSPVSMEPLFIIVDREARVKDLLATFASKRLGLNYDASRITLSHARGQGKKIDPEVLVYRLAEDGRILVIDCLAADGRWA
ncbi:uncharacterized protein LY89DRAFT_713184 [Mollisia scopiformis]|uniref:2EXR domain-containing protein n=1 Tax=Mollisia scopiformis TaxID=149040 RepID=A0A194XWB1_MOLSC|nr:uncharacterized protein LY89DRAFT_713184 [Mollisia scopiformis]KUJ24304.1 hypothetical protein LY89DRAFT_713184 [Mollisia scopiformis]